MRAIFCFLLASACYAQSVKITWVGQACFMIESDGGGPVVITDPPAASNGYPLPTVAASAVTVSHNHGDHNFVTGVRGTPALADGRTVTARTESTLGGLLFVMIPGFHDNSNGSARGQNTIVKWTQNGLKFAHFGDFGQDSLTDAQLADLRDIDVAFLPGGGGGFTTDPARIPAVIRQFNPRVAVLMHYRTALGGNAQLAGFPAVTQPYPSIRFKGSQVVLSRNTLPFEFNETWLMEVDAPAVAVNAGGSARGVPVAPGSLVSVYGRWDGASIVSAGSLPLTRLLGNTEVRVGTAAVPLWFTGPDQINFQLPAQTPVGAQIVEVRVNGAAVSRGSVTVAPSAPGIFVVYNQNGFPNTNSNPARRGDTVVIYGTGQGAVSPTVEDGASPGSSPLSRTPVDPGVFFGGQRAQIQYSGLTPGAPGVWQINAVVPTSIVLPPNVKANTALVVQMGEISTEVEVWIE